MLLPSERDPLMCARLHLAVIFKARMRAHKTKGGGEKTRDLHHSDPICVSSSEWPEHVLQPPHRARPNSDCPVLGRGHEAKVTVFLGEPKQRCESPIRSAGASNPGKLGGVTTDSVPGGEVTGHSRDPVSGGDSFCFSGPPGKVIQ